MLRPPARVRLEAQFVAAECVTQTVEQSGRIIAARLVQLEKPEPAKEDVVRSGETFIAP